MKKPKYKPIPISAAREITKKYDKQQVIVVAWDAVHGREHVTTYGTTRVACEQAAMGGNKVKAALGWPPEECRAVPRRGSGNPDAGTMFGKPDIELSVQDLEAIRLLRRHMPMWFREDSDEMGTHENRARDVLDRLLAHSETTKP